MGSWHMGSCMVVLLLGAVILGGSCPMDNVIVQSVVAPMIFVVYFLILFI